MRTELGRLLRSVARLARSWWCVDRIRSATGDSRLLRLEPPFWVRVGALTIAITGRHVENSLSGPGVVYRGEADGGSCLLQVTPIGATGRLRLRVLQDGIRRQLAAEDLQVFA